MKNGNVMSFADDTSDIYVADTLEEVQRGLQEDSDQVIKCMASNNLAINGDKTVYLLHGKKEGETVIKVDKHEVKNKTTGKLLGMTLCWCELERPFGKREGQVKEGPQCSKKIVL